MRKSAERLHCVRQVVVAADAPMVIAEPAQISIASTSTTTTTPSGGGGIEALVSVVGGGESGAVSHSCRAQLSRFITR